ncbi:MAG: hypothetical protein ACM34K_00630 [Bacillota bacterium]
MNYKFLLLVLFAISFLNCSNTEQLQKRRKLLTESEISRLNSILKEITDTLQLSIPSNYNKETFDGLPDNFKKREQDILISQGLPVRADSAYILGIRQAINNIRNGKLINKKYGLERNIRLEDGTVWKVEEIFYYILLNQYAISTDVIAGDLVNDSIVAYCKGYKSIFLPLLYRFYGFDVMKKSFDDIPEVIKNEGSVHPNWTL